MTIDAQEIFDRIHKKYMRKIKKVMSQREEIIMAFFAKYGCSPEELVQVEQKMKDGSILWFIKHRDMPGGENYLKKLAELWEKEEEQQ